MTLTKDEVLAEISWYNEQLVYLKDTFVSWMEEEGRKVDVSEEKIMNTEGLSGQYSTIKYTLIFDKNMKLCLIPYGIWIVAARGRVDISGPSGSEKLIYLYKGGPVTQFDDINEEGWHWFDDSTIRKMEKLSKEIFGYLIGRLQ